MKRKRSKREIGAAGRREAENMPSVRRLREIVEKGYAELEQRGQQRRSSA